MELDTAGLDTVEDDNGKAAVGKLANDAVLLGSSGNPDSADGKFRFDRSPNVDASIPKISSTEGMRMPAVRSRYCL